MHGSKLSLTVWFWAAYLMATHSNGMSARQLWKQLGLRSYKNAWLLCAKLRRAMVNPERDPLSGIVEVDETTYLPLAYQRKQFERIGQTECFQGKKDLFEGRRLNGLLRFRHHEKFFELLAVLDSNPRTCKWTEHFL